VGFVIADANIPGSTTVTANGLVPDTSISISRLSAQMLRAALEAL
jgi:hypothetical protein